MIPYCELPSSTEPSAAYVQPWKGTSQSGLFALNAIGPRQLATAKHTGIAAGALVRVPDGTTRRVTGFVDAPDGKDVRVLSVDADLPSWTPIAASVIYNPTDAMFIGGGYTPGGEVRDPTGRLRGWYWGNSMGKLHWTPASTKHARQPLEDYEVNFDGEAGSFAMTGGDSGGGFYVKDATGQWYLQGIGVGIVAHNGPLQVDGLNTSQFRPVGGATNLIYQSNQMLMPRAWLRSLVPMAGDADMSGTVDFNDLILLAQGYGNAGTWSNGDFDADGTVGFSDLTALAQVYQGPMTDLAWFASAVGDPSLGTSFIPEPTTLVALALPALTLTRRRRPVSDSSLARAG